MRRDHLDMRRDHLDMRRDHLDMRCDHLDMRCDHLDIRRDHLDIRRDKSRLYKIHLSHSFFKLVWVTKSSFHYIFTTIHSFSTRSAVLKLGQ